MIKKNARINFFNSCKEKFVKMCFLEILSPIKDPSKSSWLQNHHEDFPLSDCSPPRQFLCFPFRHGTSLRLYKSPRQKKKFSDLNKWKEAHYYSVTNFIYFVNSDSTKSLIISMTV